MHITKVYQVAQADINKDGFFKKLISGNNKD